MKTISPITIGSYSFDVSVEHFAGNVLEVTVKRGTDSMTRKLVHQAAHDYAEAAFENDVIQFATKRATELAGKIRSTELAKKFATPDSPTIITIGQADPKKST
jgi:membrane-bound ClpP family serine protease